MIILIAIDSNNLYLTIEYHLYDTEYLDTELYLTL